MRRSHTAKTLTCSSADLRYKICFRVLSSWWERLKGLLGTDAGSVPAALVPCSSVHTFFMRYALDVAFVDDDGKVVVSRRFLPPGRLIAAPGAHLALERPAQKGWWPQEGTMLRVTQGEA